VFRSSPTRNSQNDHLETAIVNFALLQCASRAPARLPHQPKSMRSPNLLSWSFVRPSADIPDAQVSPTAPRRKPLRPSGATQTTVPPPWFLSTVTGCSARQPQACCSLVPAMGFTAFPPFANPDTGRIQRLAPSKGIPAARFIPFDEFPSSAAVPHHCGRCPPAITACSVSALPRPPKRTLRATLRPHRP
jgi:hypothetical protein